MEFADESKKMPNRSDPFITITNRSDDLHDGTTKNEMLIPQTLSMDHGEHISVDLEYPIASNRYQVN